MSRKDELAHRLQATREQVAQLAAAAGRPAPEILPVTKFHPAADVALLAELGVTDVAENREQEARAKAQELPQLRFHMIGQVQTKKANHVARWAASVHSVDSLKLARALDRGVALAVERGERRESGDAPAILPVFIQLSADGDAARGGVPMAQPKAVAELVEAVEDSAHLRLAGFMVVPPIDADPAAVFGAARALTDEWAGRLGRELKLSAGMSADLRAAIESGTDIVRVGTGIMGPRPIL
ncbi:YggS family pyridoxal phosphate-dependent enzyme [Corynebacterium lizhenjunii]|uniref:YggS family pyridoxal phosphate-dependent enzyme n=1 Tax=Corynebacterium lizhenjunii TaxID=2709394 RepID=UPI0013ED606C|nr:YggS family pyridoxal phosphate-dependent enzyme [Corynebacterium lizhenjunii]